MQEKHFSSLQRGGWSVGDHRSQWQLLRGWCAEKYLEVNSYNSEMSLTKKLPKVLMIYHLRTLDAAGCPDIPVYRWWLTVTTPLPTTYNFLGMVHRRKRRTSDWCFMILFQNKLFSGVQKRHSLLLMITKSSTTDRMGSTMSSSQTRLIRAESKVK